MTEAEDLAGRALDEAVEAKEQAEHHLLLGAYEQAAGWFAVFERKWREAQRILSRLRP